MKYFATGFGVLVSMLTPLYGSPAPADAATLESRAAKSLYVLGPDDSVTIWALGVEEITDKPMRIDFQGYLDIPLVGRVKAAGLTIEGLKSAVATLLNKEVRKPQVTVNVVEFRSQPVSVVGEVNAPGLHQLQGHKTLLEMLSMAGGLRQTAGYRVKITRRAEWGPIPLPDTKTSSTGDFTIAEVQLKNLMEAANPEENIAILPYDAITVPRAEMFYVLGEVKKAGAFVMGEKSSVSVLQALSTAEGLGSTAATGSARILRAVPGSTDRLESTVDLRKILRGKSEEVQLHANDILFIPGSTTKKVTNRAIETSIGLGTGLLIWR